MPGGLLESLISNKENDESSRWVRAAKLMCHEDVCVAFFDICGFSRYCADTSAEAVAHRVHSVFSLLDEKCESNLVEKIRTVGDGYMATSGVFADYARRVEDAGGISSSASDKSALSDLFPGGNRVWNDPTDAGLLRCAKMLLFALEAVTENMRMLDVKIRVGLHRGRVLSGIVGQMAAQFDIFGHDVNYCARLEQNCVPGRGRLLRCFKKV